MKLRYWLLCLVVFVPLIVLAVLIIGTSTPITYPPGVELNVSESISPAAGVFVLNNDKNVVTKIGTGEWFFLQQRGLPEGTTYGFRVLREDGTLLMPVYETFTAKTANWIEPNKYYRDLGPGNYTVELLTVKNENGIIVARVKLSVFDTELERAKLETAVRNNCTRLLAEPVVDTNGYSREGKIAKCVANIGAEFTDPEACRFMYSLFNLTIFGYEECIRSYALAAGDVSACDITGMPKTRGFCKAKATRDWLECRKITCDFSCSTENLDTQQNLCIQWYAIENRDAALCNEITSTAYNMKEICLNLTAER